LDCANAGRLIRQLRIEQGLTQKNIADSLNISNKTVSKWERGMGFPDVSLLNELSVVLGADIQKMLEGRLEPNTPDSGNIRKIRFYVCSVCGNVLTSTGKASAFCCGRKLEPLKVKEQLENHRMTIEKMDNGCYITFHHEMLKSHYISFVAYVGDDILLIKKLYPEQSAAVGIPILRRGGRLYAYCSRHGLWSQPVR